MCAARTLTKHLWLNLAVAAISARAVYGQGRARLTPSVTTTGEYDSNVFATAADPQADFVTRGSMGLGVDYTAPRWTTSSRYVHDVERFENHPHLSSADARQRAALAFLFQPTGRTTWGADAEFWKTRTPGELNESTGLVFTRASARRADVHGSIRHRFDAVTSAAIDYTATQDHLAGRTDATTHDASAAIEKRRSARTTLTFGYQFREFVFTRPGAQSAFAATAHALTAGWTRAMTPHLRFTIDGGPRMTNASVRPEVSASAHYQPGAGEFSIAYTRTQTTVIGLANVTETQSLSGAWAWRLWSSVHMRLAPTVFRTEVEGSRVDAWVLAADLSRPLARGLAVDVSVNASMQRGRLNMLLANTTIARQVVLVRLVAGSSSLLR